MTDEPQPTDERAQVPPSPVPTAFTVGSVPTQDGSAMVVLQVQTPAGMGVYFLEPGIAVQVGNALRREGKAGISPRIVTPPNGLIVPRR